MNPMRRRAGLVALALLVMRAAPSGARAEGDRTQVVRAIVVRPDEAAGDVTCFGCSVRVFGRVRGDVTSFGGEIEIEGAVDGDVVALGGGIRLGAAAKVAGDAIAFGGPVESDPAALVAGELHSFPYFGLAGQRRPYLRAGLGIATVNLGGALLGFLLFRGRLSTLAGSVSGRPVIALLTGAGVFAAACFLYYTSTFLGPATGGVALLITAALFLAWMPGFAGVSLRLGRGMAEGSAPLAAVLLGAAAITALELIPLAGFVVLFGAGLLALGGTVWARMRPGGRLAEAAAQPAEPSSD